MEGLGTRLAAVHGRVYSHIFITMPDHCFIHTCFHHHLLLGLSPCQVNVANIGNIVQELFQENIVRGRLETSEFAC